MWNKISNMIYKASCWKLMCTPYKVSCHFG